MVVIGVIVYRCCRFNWFIIGMFGWCRWVVVIGSMVV